MTLLRNAGLGLVSLLLAGCAMSDEKLAHMLVAPDKFTLYRCQELAVRNKELIAREAELKGLIAQAGTGSGGQFVSSVAYRPEYLSVQGELSELRRTAAEKNCGSLAAIAVEMPAAPVRAGVPPPVPPPPASRLQAPEQ